MGSGSVERVEWDVCSPARLSLKNVVEAAGRSCRGAYFSNGYSVIVGQRAFRRHFDTPPRGCVPDRKCVSLGISITSNGECLQRKERTSGDNKVFEFDKERIVSYRDCGLSFRKIGSRVGRNQTTVMRICDRWMQEGTTDRRGRSHPPQCTTSLFARTIRRRLQQLSARRPLLGLLLTQKHRRLRRNWRDERRTWAAEWNEGVFTDESRICLQHHDGRIRVWRHLGERMLKGCVFHRHTGPAPGIMITPPAATPDQLWQRMEAAWSVVPQEHIQSLFESMPRRVATANSNNGGYSCN
ncbi:transposable element Tcb1 transposase [Trichonephila clavipes]|nr:transposable element Tcb1 transposase [Trichonephila clavipes]